MLKILGVSVALGIAGFDPVGFFALLAAAGLGATRRSIAALVISTCAPCIGLGLAFSLGLGLVLDRLTHRFDRVRAVHEAIRIGSDHRLWGVLIAVAGIALIGWGAWRLYRGVRDASEETAARPRGTGVAAMLVTGLGVGLSALADPAFYAMAVFADRLPGMGLRFGVVTLWTALSQIAMLAAAVVFWIGLFDRFNTVWERLKNRYAAGLHVGISIALLVAGVVCLVVGLTETVARWF